MYIGAGTLALILVIVLLWLIRTLGVLVTSFRPVDAVRSTGWWTVFGHPLRAGQWTIQNYRDVLDALVVELLEKETLDKAQVAEIFVPLRRREIRPAWTGSETRAPSTRPPVATIPGQSYSGANGSKNGTPIVVGPDAGVDAPAPAGPDVHGTPDVP